MRGFTLIETIVYLAIFALIMGGLVIGAYALFENADRNQTKAMLQEEENFLIGKIDFAMNGASNVSFPSANSSSSTLSVTHYGGSVEQVCFVGTNVYIRESAGTCSSSDSQLNNSNVTISNLVFIHTYAGGTNPDGVEAGFTISAKTPTGSTVSETASTTNYIQK